MAPKRRMSLMAHLAFGAGLCFGVASWMPLWRVELPTSKLSEMESGTFWDFCGNLPSALQNLGTPQEPTVILTMLPTVFLWQNVGTTLAVLGVGAALGFVVWLARWQPDEPKRS